MVGLLVLWSGMVLCEGGSIGACFLSKPVGTSFCCSPTVGPVEEEWHGTMRSFTGRSIVHFLGSPLVGRAGKNQTKVLIEFKFFFKFR